MKLKHLILNSLAACLLAFSLTSCGDDSPSGGGTSQTGTNGEAAEPCVTIVSGTDYFTEPMYFTAEAGKLTIHFNSAKSWSLTLNEANGPVDWCTISQTRGTAGAFMVTVSVAENAGYDDHSVTINFESGNLHKSIFVNQKQKDAILLTANKLELTKDFQPVNIKLQANVQCHIEIPDACKEWITLSAQMKGLTDRTFGFYVTENTGYDAREGEVHIVSDTKTEVIRITQSGNPVLEVSSKNNSVGCEESTCYISITCNFDYVVDMPELDWLHLDYKDASHITIRVDANSNTCQREAFVTIHDPNDLVTETVTFTQKPAEVISVSTKERTFDRAGGDFQIIVSSTVAYTVVLSDGSSSWLHYNGRHREGGLEMFTIDPNEGSASRTAVITFKNEKQSATVTVTQAGGVSFTVDNSYFDLIGNQNSIIVRITSNVPYTEEISNTWIQGAGTVPDAPDSHIYNIPENHTGDKRRGEIVYKSATGEVLGTVTINQDNIASPLKVTSSISLAVGGEKNINENGATATWTSSNTKVCVVDEKGNVRATGTGTATVTAVDEVGDHRATCQVTVPKITIEAKKSGTTVNGVMKSGSSIQASVTNLSVQSLTVTSLRVQGRYTDASSFDQTRSHNTVVGSSLMPTMIAGFSFNKDVYLPMTVTVTYTWGGVSFSEAMSVR